MEIPQVARKAFNARGVYVSLATVDEQGQPDVAPVGTAVVRDDGTLFLLQGPLGRTYQNLGSNPNAVLMVTDHSLLRWIRFFFTGHYGCSHGWRLYCRFREELPLGEPYISESLIAKFGGARDTKGGRAIVSTLQRVLLFDVNDVREIVWRAASE